LILRPGSDNPQIMRPVRVNRIPTPDLNISRKLTETKVDIADLPEKRKK